MTRITSTFVALLALGGHAAAQAQSVIPNTIPACAQQCALLQQAAQSCEANPAAVDSCFCQSSLLEQIKANPQSNLCAPTCSEGDWGAVASWYNSKCKNGGVTSAGAAPSTTLATSASVGSDGKTIVAASGPPAAATGGAAGGGGSSDSQAASNGGTQSDQGTQNYSNGQEWWKTHYQWIIMLIVLIIAFSVLGAVLTYYFRRHQRKQARTSGAYAGGNAAQWAPNSSTHDFQQSTDRNARVALAAKPNPLAGQEVEEKHIAKGKAKAAIGLLRKNTR